MLNDVSGFQIIYLATGYTDLRRGMEGLANIIRFRFHLDPYDRNTLFLFCGKMHEYYTTRANNPLKKKQSVIAISCKLIRVFYAILAKGVTYDAQKLISDIHRQPQTA